MDLKPKMIIAGGTGFFGHHLVEFFKNRYNITVFTRTATHSKNGVNYQYWDATTKGDWIGILEGAEVLINLTGKSINCRFTEENKKQLLSSRVNSTKVLAEVIALLNNPPKIWINASAGAMYKTGSVSNTEQDKAFNDDFLAKMSLAWEEAFFEQNLPETTRVAMRISLILGSDGGVFPVWKKITSMLLGGKAGKGDQMISWIHIDDAIKAVEFMMEHKMEGVVNFSTHHPIANKNLMKELRKQINVPFGLPAPEFGIKVGSYFLQTEPSLLLNSVNFIPERLIKEGFKFKFPSINKAFEDLV